MTVAALATSAFGRQLRQWRRQRGLSQLELANRAEMTQRHISFIETGRSRPRVGVVHKVSEALDIPIRDRNTMLEAAGLPPSYPDIPMSSEAVVPFNDAIQRMLEAHEPYPAYVVNRWWDVVNANEAGQRLFPMGSAEQLNSVDVFLGPGPIREMIANFPVVAWTFVYRMRREVANSGPDERLNKLLQRAESFLADVPRPIEDELGSELVICPQLRIGDQLIKTISMVARFGNAREVTLNELRVELVFPADDTAEVFFKQSASSQ